MQTHRELLFSILTDPGDDVSRLIYADWLEEHGETIRADFVRVQIELAQVPACERVAAEIDGLPRVACQDTIPQPLHTNCWRARCDACRRFLELRRRERELATVGGAWATPTRRQERCGPDPPTLL